MLLVMARTLGVAVFGRALVLVGAFTVVGVKSALNLRETSSIILR